MKMRRFLGLLLILALAVAAIAITGRQQHQSDDAADFETFVAAVMEEAAIPGLSIAVIKNGESVYIEGHGFADIDARRKLTADTPMNIASISKPIMGIALLRLADRGLLDLDRDINDYLPFPIDNPHVEDEVITVRHLATHTSGITDFFEVSEYVEDIDAPIPLRDHVEGLLSPDGYRFNNGEFYFPRQPGIEREYSNLAASLAGLLVESVTDQKLYEFTGPELFEPLAMTSTSWRLADYGADQITMRYETSNCVPYIGICAGPDSPKLSFVIAKLFDPSIKHKRIKPLPQYSYPGYPNGGVYSTARDLSKLTEVILNGGIDGDYAMLSEERFEEMLRLQLPPELSTRQRFFWRDRGGLTGHAGSDLGVFTQLYFDRDKKDAYIILMNKDYDAQTGRAMGQLVKRIREEFHGVSQ